MTKKILILDDDPDVACTIGAMLATLGCEVRHAQTGDEFFALLSSWLPTHVFVDLMMPEMDGIQVLSGMAESGVKAEIVIASGAGARVVEAARRASEEFGLHVAGVLQKPFDGRLLRALIGEKGMSAPGRRVPRPKSPAPRSAVGPADIERAIANREFVLAYQPKIRCATNRLVGFESLVRWNRPEHGVVMPGEFLPLAESSGLIEKMTDLIVDVGLDWLSSFQGVDKPSLSINISTRSLDDPNLPSVLAEKCAARGVDPGKIILEITETYAMSDPAKALALATRLRLKGFRLSIDDFGVGYSSLSQLARIPFSELKVDMSFVQTMNDSEESRKIVSSIVKLGHSLDLSVTAEGVEDLATLIALNNYRCDLAQGYLIGRPMFPEQLATWTLPEILSLAHPADAVKGTHKAGR